MARRANAQQMKFVRFFLTTAEEDHVQAARLAGYAAPAESGLRLFRKLEKVIEEERSKRNAVKPMGPAEIIQGLERIASNPEHRDCYNALKTLAALHKLDQEEVPREKIAADLEEIMTIIEKPGSKLSLTKSLTRNVGALPKAPPGKTTPRI